jgi:hypothetical protein
MFPVFEQEFRTYEENKADLLEKAKGKYVLIKGNNILGIFAKQWTAIDQGYMQLGRGPFLVKRIVEVEGQPYENLGETVRIPRK